MIRVYAPGLSGVMRVMKPERRLAVWASLGQGLLGQFSIKLNKRRKKGGVRNKKMGHWNKLFSLVTKRLAQSGVVINSREGVYPPTLIQNDQ